MAEERNVGLARATESQDDEESTKAELQRRMEEARESITQTVTEIKDSVTNQYQQVRETINDSLDWREQFRRRPVALSVGALSVGLLLGYGIGGAFAGRRDDSDYDEIDYDTSLSDETSPSVSNHSYAAQPITGSVHGASTANAAAAMPSYNSSGYDAATSFATPTEPEKPGLLERFKETKAFDRLQSEISTLGERVVDELSNTAQTVVLPALLGRVKDMIGIDLSTQREVAKRSKLEHETTSARVANESSADSRTTA